MNKVEEGSVKIAPPQRSLAVFLWRVGEFDSNSYGNNKIEWFSWQTEST